MSHCILDVNPFLDEECRLGSRQMFRPQLSLRTRESPGRGPRAGTIGRSEIYDQDAISCLAMGNVKAHGSVPAWSPRLTLRDYCI